MARYRHREPYALNDDGTKSGYILRHSADRRAWVMEYDGQIVRRFETEDDALAYFDDLDRHAI